MKPALILKSIFILLAFLFTGCASLIATYDQYSYTQTTSLKVDALNVMSEATEDYKLHEPEVKQVELNILKLIEYKKHLSKDSITVHQWHLLSDTSGNLFGGFISDWKRKHVLKSAFIKDSQGQVSEGFDEIIKLEVAKIHK